MPDWQVVQEVIYTKKGGMIPGYRVNIRDSDRKALGVATDRYKLIQNQEAFAFTDALIGNGFPLILYFPIPMMEAG